MNITIIYNVPSDTVTADNRASEEDTVMAAHLAKKALETKHHIVTLLPISVQTVDRIGSIQADCIVNFAEYTGMELHHVGNVFLELKKLNTPFTGCIFESYFTTADKITMKNAFDVYKIPTPKWQLFESRKEKIDPKLSYPLFIKLAYEHCGVGLNEHAVAKNSKEARAQIAHLRATYNQPVIVEEYIDGRELQVTLIDDHGSVTMLPIAEYCFPEKQKLRILTYESRWHNEAQSLVNYHVEIAKLSPAVIQKIRDISIKAYRDLCFTNYGRFDLRLRGDMPYIIETNSNPGLDDDPENGLVASYMSAGMTYADFLEHIIREARGRK